MRHAPSAQDDEATIVPATFNGNTPPPNVPSSEFSELKHIIEIDQAPAAETNTNCVERPMVVCATGVAEHESVSSLQADSIKTQEQPAVGVDLLSFYELIEQPFDVTPDPAYLYLSQVHREALTSLSDGVQNLRGFMALIAEPGMGKTTLLNKLTEELRDSARIVFLFQTQCNSRELLGYLLSELAVDYSGMDIVAMHRSLNEILFYEMCEGRRFVLIVDEAQNLDPTVLETIRLLSDFETNHSKLLQIILAGQPQVADTLMRPELSQLRQRIAVLASLEPLNAVDTARYIEHRLRAAGSSGKPIFTQEAMVLIAERSHGTPREINNLCFNALRQGHAERSRIIQPEIVQKAATLSDLELLARRHRKAGNIRSANNVALNGQLTDKLVSRTRGSQNEYRVQVSLERESNLDIPVAERHYCSSFYLNGEHAAQFVPERPIRIRIEQD